MSFSSRISQIEAKVGIKKLYSGTVTMLNGSSSEDPLWWIDGRLYQGSEKQIQKRFPQSDVETPDPETLWHLIFLPERNFDQDKDTNTDEEL